MTGFGEASAEVDGVHYFVEVRSLNSKYFKPVIRLPDKFQGLEAEMEAALRRRLARGTVTLTATCTDTSEAAAFEINHRALERYVEQIRRAAPIANGQVQLDLAPLLTLPGVLQPPGDEENRLHRAREVLLPLLDKACTALIAMRQTEGKALHEELLRQRDLISERLALIEERAPTVVAEYQDRLRTRIEALLQTAEMRCEPVELVREIAVYAERTDIAEEIARLKAHLDQFGRLLGQADGRPVGRTLDFLTQELLREANTIASKSPDSAISRAIVEVKGAIDRIKEQVQNVE